MVLRAHIVVCGFLFVLATTPPIAQADPILLTATGTTPAGVCGVCLHDALGIVVSGGDSFTFRLSFDSPSPGHTGPWSGTGSGSISFAEETVSLPPSFLDGGIANDSENEADLMSLSFRSPSGHVQFEIFGIGPVTWLNSEVWPTNLAATLSAASATQFRIFQSHEDTRGYSVIAPARITQTAAPDPIPEPSTLLLLGTGLAAGLRWRHRNQHRTLV